MGTVIRWTLTVLVVVFLGWTLANDWPAVRALRWRGGPGDALAALMFAVGGLLTLPWGLRLLMRATGYSAGLYVWRIWLQAFIYKYVPGKVALVAERIRLSRPVGVEPAMATVFVVWESVLQLLGGCLVVAAALPALTRTRADSVGPALLGGGLAGIGLLLALPWGLRKLDGYPFFRRRFGALAQVRLSWALTAQLLLVFAASWTFLGLGFFFVCRMFFDVALEAAPEVVLWYVAAYVLGWVTSIAPAGLGLREGVLVVGLSPMFGSAGALAVAAAGRLWITGIEVGCTLASTAIARPPDSDEPVSRA